MSTVLPGETEAEDSTAYACSSDIRSDGSARAQLADAVRLLVVHIGWYHRRYGDLPQVELLRMVRAETLTEETKALLLHGMHNWVPALGEVRGVGGDRGDETVH